MQGEHLPNKGNTADRYAPADFFVRQKENTKMEPIFNSQGRTVGWIEDNVIYDRNNRYRAFIEDGNIFNYQGKHLGVLDTGFFRDKRGHCVAFLDGAERRANTADTRDCPNSANSTNSSHSPYSANSANSTDRIVQLESDRLGRISYRIMTCRTSQYSRSLTLRLIFSLSKHFKRKSSK